MPRVVFEKLRSDHPIEGFDCGREELNGYLLRYAWASQQAEAAQTYVGLVGNAVVGYHTLAVCQVTREEAPERLTKGLARHPVPIMLLFCSGVRVGGQVVCSAASSSFRYEAHRVFQR